jgi:membrane-associated phospholipid phosphatase
MKFVGWERFSLMVAVPAAVASYYRVSGRSDRLADTGYYITLWLIFSTFGCVLTYIAARFDLPLRDAQFAHYDALLFFDWGRWSSFVAAHQTFEFALSVAYSTILPQTIGSVFFFSHIRRPDRNDELLRTTIVAAIITTAISGLLPAQGPHLKTQSFDWWVTLDVLRGPAPATFSVQHLQGIIVFPSFHTVAAILLTYAHRPPLRTFGATLILNLLMLLSVPSEGQHYLIDVLSGAVVAAFSIALLKLAGRHSPPAQVEPSCDPANRISDVIANA